MPASPQIILSSIMLRTMVDGSRHMDMGPDPTKADVMNLRTFTTMGLTMIKDNVREPVF